MGFNGALRTLRLSTNGGRTYQSMLANAVGGAGSRPGSPAAAVVVVVGAAAGAGPV